MTADSSANRDQLYRQLPEQLRRAVIAHEQGDLERAYPLYKQFVKDNPDNPTALQLFGLLLSQRGAYQPAIKLMQESLRLFPDQAEVANNLGNALTGIGEIDNAIVSYLDAIRIRPGYVDAWRNLGVCYTRNGRLEEAKGCLEKVIELRPDDAPARLALGNLQQQQGLMADAVATFEKAIELDPDYAEAHHNLGLCQRLLDQPDKALDSYDRALQLGLDRPELHHNRANALVDLQRRDAAIDAFRAAVERDPSNLETHRNLNALLWQQEQLEDYLGSYRRALQADPDALDLRLELARTLNRHERFGEAREVLQKGLEARPNTAEIRTLLGFAAEGEGNWDEALRWHASAVASPDAVANHQISYARALLARQRPEEALELAQAAAAQAPFNQRALAYLGLCWRLLGDERDKVLNDYQKLVQVYDVPMPDGMSTAEFNARLADVLQPLHVARQHPVEQTLRGGSQTSGHLFRHRAPEILQLVAGLNACLEDYINAFPDNDQHPLYARRANSFRYAGAWSVKLARSGFHTMHTHPMGWISSAYYVQVPDEITETDQHGGGIKFGEPDIDIGEAGQAQRSIQPKTGRLVLFPSYMWHGTVPFEADEPRMTVAFDVVPFEQ
ncbi:MAG: tetratricopeptide repeat protein [Gammaproteobacteria bacterium]|nr:tetratricopeptide repeat protein [Gammaproteobacteria bacterium]